MNLLILVFMLALPFSSIFVNINDIWHSQGAVFHLGALCILSYSIFQLPRKPLHQALLLGNKPLGIFTFWLAVTTLFWWNYAIVKDGIYYLPVLMPFVNFLSYIILYKGITRYLTKKDIKDIVICFQYIVGAMAFYGIIQRLNLDQFHRHFSVSFLPDSVVGTLGNPIHLGAWLSICLPILYYNATTFSNIAIFAVWLVILLTGSASGLIGAVGVTIFYNLFHKIRIKHERFIFLFLGVLILCGVIKYGFNHIFSFFNASGRIVFWGKLYDVFKDSAIFGRGLGILNVLKLTNGENLSIWRHAHQEYFQIAVETGLVGLGIAVWGIVSYFKIFTKQPKDKLTVCLASIFVGFLINCFFSFPAHMWLIGVVAMFSYASLFAINAESS